MALSDFVYRLPLLYFFIIISSGTEAILGESKEMQDCYMNLMNQACFNYMNWHSFVRGQ